MAIVHTEEDLAAALKNLLLDGSVVEPPTPSMLAARLLGGGKEQQLLWTSGKAVNGNAFRKALRLARTRIAEDAEAAAWLAEAQAREQERTGVSPKTFEPINRAPPAATPPQWHARSPRGPGQMVAGTLAARWMRALGEQGWPARMPGTQRTRFALQGDVREQRQIWLHGMRFRASSIFAASAASSF